MAGVERFELPTVGFGDRCSTNWNYTPKISFTLVGLILVLLELRETLEVRRYYTNQIILLKDYFASKRIISTRDMLRETKRL